MFKRAVPEDQIQYLMLDENDFRCLVRGGVVHAGNLRLALKDIGYIEMDEAIERASRGIDNYKDHVKQTDLKV